MRFVLNRKKREINVTWRLRRVWMTVHDYVKLLNSSDDRHFILRSYDAETLPE